MQTTVEKIDDSIVVKESSNQTDSTFSYSRNKQVVKPKVVKKSDYSYSESFNPKNLSTFSSLANEKKTKETPKRSVSTVKSRTRFPEEYRQDSSYQQFTRQPTEKKQGVVKTKIKSENVNIKTKTPIPRKKKM
jgi:hypothetical protein